MGSIDVLAHESASSDWFWVVFLLDFLDDESFEEFLEVVEEKLAPFSTFFFVIKSFFLCFSFCLFHSSVSVGRFLF